MRSLEELSKITEKTYKLFMDEKLTYAEITFVIADLHDTNLAMKIAESMREPEHHGIGG